MLPWVLLLYYADFLFAVPRYKSTAPCLSAKTGRRYENILLSFVLFVGAGHGIQIEFLVDIKFRVVVEGGKFGN